MPVVGHVFARLRGFFCGLVLALFERTPDALLRGVKIALLRPRGGTGQVKSAVAFELELKEDVELREGACSN